jgi:hypothetical protein
MTDNDLLDISYCSYGRAWLRVCGLTLGVCQAAKRVVIHLVENTSVRSSLLGLTLWCSQRGSSLSSYLTKSIQYET